MSSPISGFTAIPNPQMLAFMPIQSYLMMYFAGSGWQYGKRRISAMSNEEFNALTPESLIAQHSDELKRIMPTLEKSLNDITPLIRILIEQYGDFIKEALKALPQALLNAIGQGGGEFSNIPTTNQQTGGNLPPTMAGFLHYFKTLADATNVPIGELIQKEVQTFSKGGTDITGVTKQSLIEDEKRRFLELQRIEKIKQDILDKSKEGLAISQKKQIIPLTSTQLRLFKSYKQNVERVTQAIQSLKVVDKQFLQRAKNTLDYYRKRMEKDAVRIRQTKSINLVGFDLYYKWLATQ